MPDHYKKDIKKNYKRGMKNLSNKITDKKDLAIAEDRFTRIVQQDGISQTEKKRSAETLRKILKKYK